LSNSQAQKKRRSSVKRGGRSTAKKAINHTEEILKLQFQSIGEPFDPEFIKQPNWYQLRKATIAQRNEFMRLFKEYAIKHKLANKKSVIIEYAYWDLQYGWSHAP